MNREPKPLPVGHTVDFSYPDWQRAQSASMTLVRHLTGTEKQELTCLAHCAWVVQGFAQSVALPHDDHRPPVGRHRKNEAPPTTAKAQAKLLEQAFGEAAVARATGPEAQGFWDDIPWQLILEVIKMLLDRFRKGKV